MSDEDNVVELERSQVPSKKKSGKMSKRDFYVCIKRALNRDFMSELWQPFTRKFHVKLDASHPQILEELEGGVLRYISEQSVISSIMQYFDEECPHIHSTNIVQKDCKEAFFRWMSCQRDVGKIYPVLELSAPGLTFRRLPWDLTPGPTPLFDEFMERLTNTEAFMQWVGSLFHEKSDRSQYVWLYGTGRNGKSTLANELRFVFGDAYSSESPPGNEDRFWTSGLLGKRLVVFADCRKAHFPTSDLFKQLTGGDLIRMEQKGKPQFYSEILAKFLFLSNDRPQIGRNEADMRRAIFCEIGKIKTDFGHDYPALLRQELPHFLFNCKELYSNKCNGITSIKVDEKNFARIINQEDEKFGDFFTENFIISPNCSVSTRDMNKIMALEKWDEFRQQRFRLWLEQTYQVERKKCRTNSIPGQGWESRYKGIKKINSSVSYIHAAED